MPNYYLDIETTGLDPKKDKIITIQFMELDMSTGEPKGELIILKEWESSEKEVIEKFIEMSKITDPYPFSFVPVGYNLGFEHNFFVERCKFHNLNIVDILTRPFIDLRSCGVIMNYGQFKGSGLDKLTGKPQDGSVIPQLYSEGKHEEIEKYIKIESTEFIKFCVWLYKELPGLLKKFKEVNKINIE
jgi:DNA polymerase III epsilon subunit-like protein